MKSTQKTKSTGISLWGRACLAVTLLLALGTTYSPEPEEIPEISMQINHFSIKLLKENARQNNSPANLIISPQGIFQTLGMCYIASGGETRKELAQTMNFPADNKQFMDNLKTLRQQWKTNPDDDSITLKIANSLWLDNQYAKFRKSYTEQIHDYFGASLYEINLQKRSSASETINQWASEKTNGKIKRILTPEALKSKSSIGIINEPALVAVNAIYFKGDWASKFEKSSTGPETFHLDRQHKKQVTMMRQESILAYSENDDFKFLELAYIGDKYSMYLLMPKQTMTIKEIMPKLTPDTFIDMSNRSFPHEVDVWLPKFSLDNKLKQKDILSQMGIKEAFNSQSADFDKMIIKTPEAYLIYLDQIYQNAWIEVNEDGSEAAAATAVVSYSIGCSCANMPSFPWASFHADHPFLFLIVHNKSRSVLFAGWISNPKD